MDESISISPKVGLMSSVLQPNNITPKVIPSEAHVIFELFQNITLPKTLDVDCVAPPVVVKVVASM
jgi:hypothetical protein